MRYADVDDGGTRISVVGLGTWQFGSKEWGYGQAYDTGEAERIVARALELGVTLFDTAEVYGFGRSERILGRALARSGVDRSTVFLATKIFPVLPLAPVVQQRGIASAERLGVRHLDLYQVHQPNPVVRDATTMRGMRTLVATGLVRHVGVSNYSLQRWRAAEAALGSPVLSNQVQYSLAHVQPDADLVPHARTARRLVIAWSPLAQGFLTGRYDAAHPPSGGVRAANPLFLPENLERGRELLATLREVADAHAATPSQVALAWVIRTPQVVVIPGASSVAQLESNVAAADLALTPDELDALTAAAARFRPLGGARAGLAMARARLGR